MEQRESSIPRAEQSKPKERMSDEQLGILLSTIGNHEVKAITLIAMADENIYARADINRKIMYAQGENKGWEVDRNLLFSYFQHSLVPSGLVRKITNPNSSGTYFQITEKGLSAVPFCGLLLDFSERYNVALAKLFGYRVKSSPLTALQIIREMASSPSSMREADLASKINKSPQIVASHLRRFSEAGLINYLAIEPNESRSKYKVMSGSIGEKGNLSVYKISRKFTEAIMRILRNYPDQYLTLKQIYDLLPPEEQVINPKDKISRMSKVLMFLSKQGLCEAGDFNWSKYSDLSLSERQRKILKEALQITDRFQDGDSKTFDLGAKIAQEIIANPQQISNLFRRAKEASNRAKQNSRLKTLQLISAFITSNPHTTNKEIGKFLAQKRINLTATAVIALTSALIKSGTVEVQKEGVVYKFSPKVPSDN